MVWDLCEIIFTIHVEKCEMQIFHHDNDCSFTFLPDDGSSTLTVPNGTHTHTHTAQRNTFSMRSHLLS